MSAFITEGTLYLFNTFMGMFEPVLFNGNIVSASSDEDNRTVCFIDSNNDLWARGPNSDGLLGLIGVNKTLEFVRVPINFKVKRVVCMSYCTFVIDVDGNIWYTGHVWTLRARIFTQLTQNIVFIDIASGGGNIFGVDINGDLWGYGQASHWNSGQYLTNFAKITENTKFINVSCKGSMIICVDQIGQAWGCGLNRLLGLEPMKTPWEFNPILEGIIIKDSVCGIDECYLLTEDGRLLRYGMKLYGQSQVTGVGIPEDISPGISVSQIDYGVTRLMLKDNEDNVWISGFYHTRIFPFEMIQGMKADSLVNQKNILERVRRFWTTKRSRNS